MDLTAWLDRIERLHSKDIELGLTRLLPVARRLGVTTLPGRVISVAGTNGKGSTVALMEALALGAGQSVACYTSPHIHRFNERLRINGEPVDDQALVAAFERVEQARQSVPLTYFEFTTLAALVHIAGSAPELVVLEVGLGGRLDAVNLVDADVAVVTSIGLDHTEWLGQTREAIAVEKCGIARPGRPLVYGEVDRPVTVDEQAARMGATLVCAGEDFGGQGDRVHWQSGTAGRQVRIADVPLGVDNLATALQGLALAGLEPDDALVCERAACTRLAARCQTVHSHGVDWVFDVGHNLEALSRLVNRLPGHAGRTRVVLGMLGDKPARAVLSLLASLAGEWHLLTLPPPRGLDAGILKDWLGESVIPVYCHDTADALASTLLDSEQPGDRVLVLGSFLTVDAVASALGWSLPGQLARDAGIRTPERTQ